jgi:hypothetical protein
MWIPKDGRVNTFSLICVRFMLLIFCFILLVFTCHRSMCPCQYIVIIIYITYHVTTVRVSFNAGITKCYGWVADLLLCIWLYPILILLAWSMAILTVVFYGFSWSIHAKSRVVPQNRPLSLQGIVVNIGKDLLGLMFSFFSFPHLWTSAWIFSFSYVA